MSNVQQQSEPAPRDERSLVIQAADGAFYKIPQERLAEFRMSDEAAQDFLARIVAPPERRGPLDVHFSTPSLPRLVPKPHRSQAFAGPRMRFRKGSFSDRIIIFWIRE